MAAARKNCSRRSALKVILGASGTGAQKSPRTNRKQAVEVYRDRVCNTTICKKASPLFPKCKRRIREKIQARKQTKRDNLAVPPRRFVRILQVKTAQGAQGQGQNRRHWHCPHPQSNCCRPFLTWPERALAPLWTILRRRPRPPSRPRSPNARAIIKASLPTFPICYSSPPTTIELAPAPAPVSTTVNTTNSIDSRRCPALPETRTTTAATTAAVACAAAPTACPTYSAPLTT
jgi:hypothetical protein